MGIDSSESPAAPDGKAQQIGTLIVANRRGASNPQVSKYAVGETLAFMTSFSPRCMADYRQGARRWPELLFSSAAVGASRPVVMVKLEPE